ncbi:MAG: G5 domain-containing protein [Clostridia bacterium]
MLNCLKKATAKTISVVFNACKKISFKAYAVTGAICILVVCTFTVATSAKTYEIKDKDRTLIAYSHSNNLNKVLANAKLSMGANDKAELTEFSNLKTNIVLKRAYTVNVIADGDVSTVVLSDGNVAEALSLAKVTLNEQDAVNVNLQQQTIPSMDIVVNRVYYSQRTEKEPVDFGTTNTKTYTLGVGKSKVVSQGIQGEKDVVYQDKYVDGEIVESTVLNQTVTREPVNQVVALGLSPKTPLSPFEPFKGFSLDENGKPTSYKSVIKNAISVAYSARAGAGTASGRKAQQGSVAVDAMVIPSGTKLYITSEDNKHIYGYAIAADTGVALREKIIDVDLFFDTYEDSCKWGKKKVNIYILS